MMSFKSRYKFGTAGAAFSACNPSANSAENNNNYAMSDTAMSVSVFVISVLRLWSIINVIIGIIINRIIISDVNKYSKGNLKAAA